VRNPHIACCVRTGLGPPPHTARVITSSRRSARRSVVWIASPLRLTLAAVARSPGRPTSPKSRTTECPSSSRTVRRAAGVQHLGGHAVLVHDLQALGASGYRSRRPSGRRTTVQARSPSARRPGVAPSSRHRRPQRRPGGGEAPHDDLRRGSRPPAVQQPVRRVLAVRRPRADPRALRPRLRCARRPLPFVTARLGTSGSSDRAVRLVVDAVARILAHPRVSVGCPYTSPIRGHRVRQRPAGSPRFLTHAMGCDGVGNALNVNRTLEVGGSTLLGSLFPLSQFVGNFSLFGARAIGGSRGELPGQLRLAPLCPARRSAVENDERNVRGGWRSGESRWWTARTSLRSRDALRSRHGEDRRGATSSATHTTPRSRRGTRPDDGRDGQISRRR
jgi:hypothetical protein